MVPKMSHHIERRAQVEAVLVLSLCALNGQLKKSLIFFWSTLLSSTVKRHLICLALLPH